MAMSDPRFHNIVELQFVSSEDAEYFLQNGEIPSTTSSRTTPRDSLNSEGAEEAYREEVPSSTEQVPPGESSKTQVSGSNQVPDYSMLVNRTSINDSVNQSQEPSFDQVGSSNPTVVTELPLNLKLNVQRSHKLFSQDIDEKLFEISAKSCNNGYKEIWQRAAEFSKLIIAKNDNIFCSNQKQNQPALFQFDSDLISHCVHTFEE